LYSILIRIKEGFEPKAKENAILQELTESVEEEPEEIITEREISEHIKMQWTLINLGLKTGSNVWIPKGDQSRITKEFNYDKFEERFTSGIDVGAKYVENIDVVWKEEFRIDAAFEIENSTSIYSGLLRFSDLKIVAPNSNYPLFIVAPLNRKRKVFEQVKRPTFKKIEFDKKVRYLSYEVVKEIDKFFENSVSGLNVDVITGRSEIII
jgi:hypothetical protein